MSGREARSITRVVIPGSFSFTVLYDTTFQLQLQNHIDRAQGTLVSCTRKSLLDLPDADNVSHFVQDRSFENAFRFQVGNVVYVKGHFPHVTDGTAGIPNTGWTCDTEYVETIVSRTVDFCQRGVDQ